MLLQTLGLPTELFQIVLANAAQQHGTASSLRLTCRSTAHRCGALQTGETARQALIFPHAMLLCILLEFQGELLCPPAAGTLHLEHQTCIACPEEFQRWLWQVGVLQRAFPNSTLKLDDVVHTSDEVDILQLLNCTELRSVTICPMPAPDGRGRQFWCAIATLGSRLQLHVRHPGAQMLKAEPSLAAHVSQANLRCVLWPWSADAGSGLVDEVSSLSSLTQLTLPVQGSVLGQAGMLDALRQLSVLQSLFCLGDDMQTLLVNAVPRSWSLLTQLKLIGNFTSEPDPLEWSLLEQQCPRLQALAVHSAVPLCLTTLTSLTCLDWRPQGSDRFQCSRLGDLHVKCRADPNLLPSTLTSLSLYSNAWWEPSPSVVNVVDDHLRSQQSLVHMCFESLGDALYIQELVPANHPI